MKTKRLLAMLLALALFVAPVAVFAAEKEPTYQLTVTLKDDSEGIVVSDKSSAYLTEDSLLIYEIANMVEKNYEDLKIYASPAFGAILREGVSAYRTSPEAWDRYVNYYYDVINVKGESLKDIVKNYDAKVGELTPGVRYTMRAKNTVIGDPKNSVNYTLTIILYRTDIITSVMSPDVTGVAKLLDTNHIAYMQGDAEGTFRPNAAISRAEAASVFYNLLKNKDVPTTVSFTDISEDAWYADDVKAIASLGIIKGDGDGCFRPADNITRAEFITMAARFAKKASSLPEFTDVTLDHWAYENITTAFAYGWISSADNNAFRPDDAITRAEVCDIINKMLERSADAAYIEENIDSLNTFSDVDPETCWAYYQIMEATNTHDHSYKDGFENWH